MRCIIVVLSLLIVVKSSVADDCLRGNGGCEQKCDFVDGKVKCSCKEGYEINHDNITCHVTDLCKLSNGGCDQKCTSDHNAKVKVVCSCESNYQLKTPGGKVCEYKNLCTLSGNKGGCQHNCRSIAGKSIVCTCRPGFELDDDGKSCYDGNLCANANGGCEQICTNVKKDVKCSCSGGFSVDPSDPSKCIDVKPYVDGVRAYLLKANDECKVNKGNCSHYCHNTVDSYYCSCPRNYELAKDRRTCEQWSWYFTLIIILAIFLFILLLITICCICGKFKWLQENICCKCFCSWKCCMTGLFCKCNKRSEADVTDLYYHQVQIQIAPIKDGRLWTSEYGNQDL